MHHQKVNISIFQFRIDIYIEINVNDSTRDTSYEINIPAQINIFIQTNANVQLNMKSLAYVINRNISMREICLYQ